MRTALSLALALLLGQAAFGQIEAKDQYAVGEPVVIVWKRGILPPKWTVAPKTGLIQEGMKAYVWGEVGEYKITGTTPRATATVTFAIGGDPQPEPKPEPTPPKPKPPVPPLPTGKLWVLIVDDPLQHAKLPQAQVNALTAKKVRDLLKDKCAVDESGSYAFRIAAPGETFAKDTKLWQEAAAKLKGKELAVPYWMIGSEATGQAVIEPFPASADAAVTRLNQMGGK